jgi:hypothetical protein
MSLRTSTRPLAAPLTGVLLALGALTGCGGGGEGSKTDCGLNGCTVTFSRDGTPSVSVLGINARLVSLQNGQANIEVAGQTVSVPVGGETQSDGFTIRVERATDSEVVVRITP